VQKNSLRFYICFSAVALSFSYLSMPSENLFHLKFSASNFFHLALVPYRRRCCASSPLPFSAHYKIIQRPPSRTIMPEVSPVPRRGLNFLICELVHLYSGHAQNASRASSAKAISLDTHKSIKANRVAPFYLALINSNKIPLTCSAHKCAFCGKMFYQFSGLKTHSNVQ
jgi:hypothetical protein